MTHPIDNLNEVMSTQTPLWGLLAEASTIERAIIEAGGEISPEIEQKLSSLDLSVAEKVDATQAILERLEGSAEMWRARAQAMTKLARSIEDARERLKEYVKRVMSEAGKTELPGNHYKLRLKNSKAKLEIDETTLDPAYLREERRLVPDKDRIREDLERGVPVTGAYLVPTMALTATFNRKGL